MKYAKLPNTREEAAECTEITGSADLRSYGHALPKLASIGGSADLRSYGHALPKLASIGGYAYLSLYGHALPKLASIGGDAYLNSYGHALPKLASIGGYAYLSSYGHALPKLASMGRSADLSSYGHALPLMMKGVPKIKHLDKKILERIEANPKCFDMSKWHCGTTHCRAGHAIDLAGENGYALEKKFSPSVAGALIYMASCPGKEVPNFSASNEDALADIKRRAK